MFIHNYKRCTCVGGNTTFSHHDREIEKAGKTLQLTAVVSRLKLLLLLKKGPHCVCDLTAHTKLSQTLISHHLSDLAEGGILESVKDGKFAIYKLTPKGMKLVNSIESIIKLEKSNK